MEGQGYEIEYEGKAYPSFKAFADAYELNYPKASACYREGKTLEEIIQRCQFSSASKAKKAPPETSKRMYVEYNGVRYTSLYAAADALGIHPSRVYAVRERKGCTPEQAIAYVLEHSIPAGSGKQMPQAAPCVVEGVEYPSQEAALAAYRMKRITVYSRMRREGISFEEAIVRGRNSATYRKPVPSLFQGLYLIPSERELKEPEILADLSRSLAYYHSKVQVMADVATDTYALLVDGATFLGYNKAARGVEMLTELPFRLEPGMVDRLNEAYVAVKLFESRSHGCLVLGAFQSAMEEGQRIEPLLNAWFSYTSIRDSLLHRFAPELSLAVPEKKAGKEPAGT
ncbi:hypothetical protein [uncultured Flavonifractor sp.]|uniref:hypothetical protein n=1 Tax=uncultured Flavonifractor sp. TaxID=1193534 RepID=UPI0025978391|nr:hypothetical protein [uncultured Flavonifractor sp.]